MYDVEVANEGLLPSRRALLKKLNELSNITLKMYDVEVAN